VINNAKVQTGVVLVLMFKPFSTPVLKHLYQTPNLLGGTSHIARLEFG
jgi:hypothetical protein